MFIPKSYCINRYFFKDRQNQPPLCHLQNVIESLVGIMEITEYHDAEEHVPVSHVTAYCSLMMLQFMFLLVTLLHIAHDAAEHVPVSHVTAYCS